MKRKEYLISIRDGEETGKFSFDVSFPNRYTTGYLGSNMREIKQNILDEISSYKEDFPETIMGLIKINSRSSSFDNKNLKDLISLLKKSRKDIEFHLL